MKLRDGITLIFLLACACVLIILSPGAKAGAKEGLALAQNTILPSLLPLLMIFMIIMKSKAGAVLTNLFGGIIYKTLKLPAAALPAVLFGLIGGYPTGAMLTQSLYRDGDISRSQAQRIMKFNVCGGAGFIITAVGTVTLSSQKAGLILFASNVLSSIIIAVGTSFGQKRDGQLASGTAVPLPIGDAMCLSASEGMKSMLNLTAFIVLFSAFDGAISVPKLLEPIFEITNGICTGDTYTLPETSAFLAFGGFCIHLQLLSSIKEFGMSYISFLVWRIVGAFLSYWICKGILLIFPQPKAVFSNVSETLAQPSIANAALSVLLILGCGVLVMDLHSRRRKV